MWLQGIAAILPQVQNEFNIRDQASGLIITSCMIGMIVGGILWGSLADIIGRKPSFTLTLLIAFIFGTSAAISPTFAILCVLLALMGIGVGGNLPVDGALFLEFVPAEQQGLLTLLSLFWPAGSVLSSLISLALIPGHSCSVDTDELCTSDSNRGWRYVLLTLGLITLAMLISRVLFFRLLESPKFLLSRGKVDEAVLTLKILAKRNGKEVDLDARDFENLRQDTLVNEPQEKETRWEQFSQLFSSKMWITTILVWLIWIFVSFGYTMFNGFLTKFLESRGGDPLTQSQLYIRYVIVNLFGIPGSILGMMYRNLM